MTAGQRLRWAPIIERAAEIVRSYAIPVTLRQLYYRLVSEALVPPGTSPYKTLSKKTAPLRRAGQFPALFDRGREILQPSSWTSPDHALNSLIRQYRVDRTVGQDFLIFLGLEKRALAGLLEDWFNDYGVPVLPLGGYSSESLEREVREHIERDGRPAILIYAGDFDASGMDIGRSFIELTADCWHETHRIGLSERQIAELGLIVIPGNPDDSRAPKFIERYPDIHAQYDFGVSSKTQRRIPVQVELDAVDPAVLHQLFLDAIARYWDDYAYQEQLDQEQMDLSELMARAA